MAGGWQQVWGKGKGRTGRGQTSLLELVTKVVDSPVFLIKAKGSGIGEVAVHGTGLASHALHKHAYGHARRERVGVDDDVGSDAVFRKGHVMGGPEGCQGTLLPVPARELVTDDGPPVVTQFDAYAQHWFAGAIAHEAHLIDLNVLGALHHSRLAFSCSRVHLLGPMRQSNPLQVHSPP